MTATRDSSNQSNQRDPKTETQTRNQTQDRNQTTNWDWYSRNRQKQTRTRSILRFAMFAITVVTAYFIFLNIQPYISIVELMLESAINTALWQFLLGVPVVGSLLNGIQSIGTTLIAVFIWVVIQFFELLPILLRRNQGTIRQVIEGLQKVKFLKIDDNDHPYIAKLKDEHNNFGIRQIQKATWIASMVYAVDCVLCLWRFPPIRGGFNGLGLFLMAPSPSDVDWSNLLIAIVTLFAVEVLVVAWLWLRNLIQNLSTTETRPA